jgi:hypothetical protein
MLCFAIQYCKAIEDMTSDRTNDLRRFELVEEEWAIAEELRDMLKVSDHCGSAAAVAVRH